MTVHSSAGGNMHLSAGLRSLSSRGSPMYSQTDGLLALIAIIRIPRPFASTIPTEAIPANFTLQAPDVPLDVLGAESEGQIGYLLETALAEALPESEVALHTSICHLRMAVICHQGQH